MQGQDPHLAAAFAVTVARRYPDLPEPFVPARAAATRRHLRSCALVPHLTDQPDTARWAYSTSGDAQVPTSACDEHREPGRRRITVKTTEPAAVPHARVSPARFRALT